MQPTGPHEDFTGFLTQELTLEYSRLHLPYRIPQKALVKPNNKETGYNPDLLLVDRRQLTSEPLWEKKSTLIYGASIPIVIEVVSTAVATLREAALRASTSRETLSPVA